MIDKEVPIPETRRKEPVYPFHEMDVHDSFYVSIKDYHVARAAAAYHGKKYSKRFITRKFGKGYRIWRTE